MSFRYDINGLRAIAIIAVVLFHFNPTWIPGGFAGVDVFFVISGFLMTSIIFKGLENNNFKLFKFYVARANRIIPALAALCLALLIFGWFNLNPIDYSTLGKHAASSMGFLSNIIYWRESGYFDTASNEKWLLHTWSLSVEWQFYIIYPIILIVLKRFLSLKNLKRLVVIGTLLGFAFSIIATIKWPNPAYYLLPTRAWEMMMGGVAFLYPWNISETKKKIIEIAGLLLILISYAFVSSDTPWPGHFALVPVLGSYFVIVANQQSSFITNNKTFQYLGKWSYSIYLWHWPVVVFGHLFDIKNWYLYGIILSVILGFMSFSLIERLKFSSFHHWLDIFKLKPLYIALIIMSCGLFVFKFTPNQYLHSMKESILDSIKRKHYECFDKKLMHENDEVVCRLTNGSKSILAIGDSHSYSYLPVIEHIAKNNNIELFYTGFSGCPPVIKVSPIRSDQHLRNCNTLNEKALKFVIDNNVDTVFLSARWTYYTEGEYNKSNIQYLTLDHGNKVNDRNSSINALKQGLEATLKAYNENGIEVILMLQAPMQLDNPDNIFYRSLLNGEVSEELLAANSVSLETHSNFQKTTNSLILEVTNKFTNVTVLSPSSYMCLNGSCLVGNKNISYYFDDDHLSIEGSYSLMKPIEKVLLD